MSHLARICAAIEPRGKGRPRFAGHAYTDAKTAAYEATLRDAAREAMGSQIPFDGPCTVTVFACFAVPPSWPEWKRAAALIGYHRPTTGFDVDNILKAALDPLRKIVFVDDKQVVSAHVVKSYAATASIDICVERIGACP